MKRWWCLFWAMWALGANAAGTLQITDAYVREMPPGQSTSAAYMALRNNSDRPIAIVAATCDSASIAELHASSSLNGMMQMTPVRRLVVPAHGQVILAPSGIHLMLINLKRSFHAGDRIGITLIDEEGKFYAAKLPVIKLLGAASLDSEVHAG